MQICTIPDEYTEDGLITQWVAELTDGQVVYRDDFRPGCSPPIAWTRLKQYCEHYGLGVKRLWLKNRDHFETPVPNDAEGYYMVNKIGKSWGDRRDTCGFVIGHLQNGVILCSEWQVPELLLVGDSTRDPVKYQECLIVNPR
jgi:hypothetical protein